MAMLSSMWGRVFGALLIGVLLSATLTVWLAFGEREKTLMQYRESHSIDRIEQLISALDTAHSKPREFSGDGSEVGVTGHHITRKYQRYRARSDYARAVSERLGQNFRVLSLPTDPSTCPRPPKNAVLMRVPCEALSITLHDGTVLRLTVMPPKTPAPPLRDDFIQYFFLFLTFIAVLALIIARMTMRPLRHMAEAATALGQDINRPPLPKKVPAKSSPQRGHSMRCRPDTPPYFTAHTYAGGDYSRFTNALNPFASAPRKSQ
jgi:hypothetical protein